MRTQTATLSASDASIARFCINSQLLATQSTRPFSAPSHTPHTTHTWMRLSLVCTAMLTSGPPPSGPSCPAAAAAARSVQQLARRPTQECWWRSPALLVYHASNL
jgi:hypothetical protein